MHNPLGSDEILVGFFGILLATRLLENFKITHMKTYSEKERREKAIEILARMDIYAEEQFGKEFNDLDLHQCIDIMSALIHSGVIQPSEVTFM